MQAHDNGLHTVAGEGLQAVQYDALQALPGASFGWFEADDIFDDFLDHGYTLTSYAGVNNMGRLKRVCKLFRSAVIRHFAIECKIEPEMRKTQANMFALTLDDTFQRAAYDEFFAGVRSARIHPSVQSTALGAFSTHIKSKPVMDALSVRVGKSEKQKRCSVVASVMRFHRSDPLVVGFGMAILDALMHTENIDEQHYPCIASAIIDAMYMFPENEELQTSAASALYSLTGKHASAVVACCMADGDAVALVLAAMRLKPEDRVFQWRSMDFVQVMTGCLAWRRRPPPPGRVGKNDPVDRVWAQGVEICLLHIINTKENTSEKTTVGIQALANMAKMDIRRLGGMQTLTRAVVNWLQMFAAGRTLHAMAMAPVCASCVQMFSYDARVGGSYVQNQNFFADAGVIPLMLAGLNAYTKGQFNWPMKTAANVIKGLDALCRNNHLNTAKFVNADGVDILIRAAFYSTMCTEQKPNFTSEAWVGALGMLYHIMTLKVRLRRPIEDISTDDKSADNDNTAAAAGAVAGSPADQGAADAATYAMPFLNLLSKKFPNTISSSLWLRSRTPRNPLSQEYYITELPMLCIREKLDSGKPHDTLVCLCLELLCVCMKKPEGLLHMGDSGVESVLALKTQNAAKTRSCLEMDVLCVEVLTVAACPTRMLALHSGLIEVVMTHKGLDDGLSVKLSKQLRQTETYIEGARRAKQACDKLRVALLRMQLKESMHIMFADAKNADDIDKKEMRRHTLVPANQQSQVPRELNAVDTKTVTITLQYVAIF